MQEWRVFETDFDCKSRHDFLVSNRLLVCEKIICLLDELIAVFLRQVGIEYAENFLRQHLVVHLGFLGELVTVFREQLRALPDNLAQGSESDYVEVDILQVQKDLRLYSLDQ